MWMGWSRKWVCWLGVAITSHEIRIIGSVVSLPALRLAVKGMWGRDGGLASLGQVAGRCSTSWREG